MTSLVPRALTKEELLEKRIHRYLRDHKEGVSGRQVTAWLRSIRKYDITLGDVEAILYRMRDAGTIACTGGIWWPRKLSL